MSRTAIARARGNFPAALGLAERLVSLAGGGFRELRSGALVAIGTSHAIREEFGRALQYCWRGYLLVAGSGRKMELDALTDLSLVLMNSGHVAEARAAMAYLLHRVVGDTLYIILAGYAEASGRLGDRAGVEWGTDQLLIMERERRHPRFVAQSFIECAFALAAVGDTERAAAMMGRTLELARAYNFHDLVFRAEQSAPAAPRRIPLDDRAAAIVGRVKELEPGELPRTLAYAG
jgi:hypothetical protein